MRELYPYIIWLAGIYLISRAIYLWRQNAYDRGYDAGYGVRTAEDYVEVHREPKGN